MLCGDYHCWPLDRRLRHHLHTACAYRVLYSVLGLSACDPLLTTLVPGVERPLRHTGGCAPIGQRSIPP